MYDNGMEDSTESFNDLVKEMTSKRPDVKAFAFRTKAMVRHSSNRGIPYLSRF